MSRRVLIRAISFIAFAFLITLSMTIQNMERAKRYEQVINDAYYYEFSELLSGVSKLECALEKCAYSADSSMLAALCAEAFREADVSSRALAKLPVAELSLENTTKFISQAGDYSYYLSKKAVRGEAVTKEEYEKLLRLAVGAQNLTQELREISEGISNESIKFESIDFENTENDMFKDIKALEREFSEYPVLIYDGPFSDETVGECALLAELDEINKDDAIKKCKSFLNGTAGELKVDCERQEDGVQLFSVTDGETYIDITKRGGILFRMVSSENPQNDEITVDKATDIAYEFLNDTGFDELTETYHMRYGNTLTINFAKRHSNTVIYPDLVKVTVSLENGNIINFDAAGYVKNSKERDIKDISATREEAENQVSKELKVLSYEQTIIPTDGTGEILTHEFKCETKSGKHCIVYVNPDTLCEERILILIESENGTLTM